MPDKSFMFERFCEIAYDSAGIRLGESKRALVAARIAKRQRALGIEGAERYLQILESDQTGCELSYFIDAISTNYTRFFREPDHFDLLRERVREWANAGRRRIRLWSAACATGEEPYSMAMAVLDALGGRDVDFRILATDISTRAIASAHAGIFTEESLSALSPDQTERFFTAYDGRSGDRVQQVGPQLRAHVLFRRLNLSRPPFPFHGPLDAVFCRNVMIYFDRPVQERLLAHIEGLLAEDGFLVTGLSENVCGFAGGLEPIGHSVFRRRQQPGPGA